MISQGTELIMDFNRPRRSNAVYVDLKGRKLISGRNAQLFTPHEWTILVALWNCMPHAAKRSDLIKAIWGDVTSDKATRTVDVHIAAIRKKLSAIDVGSIDSIYGLGYRFIPGRKKLIFSDSEKEI